MTASERIGLAGRLKAGDRLLAGWSGIADPAIPEQMARGGFDAVVLDMQHGAWTVSSALLGIGAVALAGAPCLARIPIGDFATAARLCDGGAAAIIAPMIDTIDDAQAFVAAVKYPPLGARSWGPHRALALSGLGPAAYLAHANGQHLALPMIETAAALAILDDILAVPGVDGVFVGPSDLSIALTGGTLDPGCAAVERALDRVAARAGAAGKIAAAYCLDGPRAKALGARGFALCAVASDASFLDSGIAATLHAAR